MPPQASTSPATPLPPRAAHTPPAGRDPTLRRSLGGGRCSASLLRRARRARRGHRRRRSASRPRCSAGAVAALPLGIVVPAFLWLDRYEAEPARLLLFAFAWGAVVRRAGALVLNTARSSLLQQAGPGPGRVASAVLVAPLVEEGAQGRGGAAHPAAAAAGVRRGRRRHRLRGLCAAGFAFIENILYLGRAFGEGGSEGLAPVVHRALRHGPFAHPLFTVLHRDRARPRRADARRAAAACVAPLCGLPARRACCTPLWNLSSVAGLAPASSASTSFLQIPLFLGFVGARRLGPPTRGSPHRHVPAPVRRRRLAQPSRGGDALVGARSPRRRGSWARPTGGRPALAAMRGVPGRRERAGAAARADGPR